MATTPLVDTSIEVLKKMPPESKMEDIMNELHLIDQVLQGMSDAEKGKVVSTGELLERMNAWRKV